MTHTEFIELVASMRALQKQYFELRRSDNHSASKMLPKCKEIEQRVDKYLLSVAVNRQPGLF